MFAKSFETHNTISALFCPLPPLPPENSDFFFEIWSQSLGIGVGFVQPNVLHSKLNIVPGEGGHRFPLRGDL